MNEHESSSESPAKEQPGEVAAMVKRLNAHAAWLEALIGEETLRDADQDVLGAVVALMRNAAALIEKLGQGWIPVSSGRRPEAYPFVVRWNDETEFRNTDEPQDLEDQFSIDNIKFKLPPPPERP